ncbi:MAG TPA: hypothetical protein O0X70_02365, partial [Methanocorpusculum sp.]|nr:hypothetical protein [Methanocorpusculum sp.]
MEKTADCNGVRCVPAYISECSQPDSDGAKTRLFHTARYKTNSITRTGIGTYRRYRMRADCSKTELKSFKRNYTKQIFLKGKKGIKKFIRRVRQGLPWRSLLLLP